MTASSLKRATYDKAVIAAWQAQRLRHREIVRKDVPRYFIIAACMAPLYFITPPLPIFAIVVAFIGYTHYRLVRDAPLFDCPQCGEPALQGQGRESSVEPAGMFCPHCHYWLTSPYSADHVEDSA